MKYIKINENEWYYIEKVINQMKEDTAITIRITKTGQIYVYKTKEN